MSATVEPTPLELAAAAAADQALATIPRIPRQSRENIAAEIAMLYLELCTTPEQISQAAAQVHAASWKRWSWPDYRTQVHRATGQGERLRSSKPPEIIAAQRTRAIEESEQFLADYLRQTLQCSPPELSRAFKAVKERCEQQREFDGDPPARLYFYCSILTQLEDEIAPACIKALPTREHRQLEAQARAEYTRRIEDYLRRTNSQNRTMLFADNIDRGAYPLMVKQMVHSLLTNSPLLHTADTKPEPIPARAPRPLHKQIQDAARRKTF